MQFYDRDQELDALNNIVSTDGSALIVISGRRRIGKTRLIEEFLRTHEGLRIMVVPKEEKQMASDFSELFSTEGFRPTFTSVKDAIEYFFSVSRHRILFVDEFSNFLEIDRAIPYEFQKTWDLRKSRNKVLILSGSYSRMMDKIFTRQKAPLFNRATLKLILEQLDQRVICRLLNDLGISDAKRQINLYCVIGGIHYYYELIERLRPENPVEELFFGIGPLIEEGLDILRQEFGSSYRKYFAILEAVGSGLVTAGEISSRTGARPTTNSKYLQALKNDFKLLARQVPFGEDPIRSKRGRYMIADNTIAFWFSRVYGKVEPPSRESINSFVGQRFEFMCSRFLERWVKEKGEKILKRGKWWGTIKTSSGKFEQRELDLVIETDQFMYVGECKWVSRRMGRADLEWLKESASNLKSKKAVKWVLFSKSGFSMDPSEDVMLFDAERLVAYSPKL